MPRLRLVRATSMVLGASLLAFSLILYLSFSRALRRQLDEQLEASARAVADMVEERAQGPWELELADMTAFKEHISRYGWTTERSFCVPPLSATASWQVRRRHTAVRFSRTWDRAAADYRIAIEACLEITDQMSHLVERLLMLSKLDDRALVAANEPVDIAALVEAACARHAKQATERGLRLENRVGTGATVTADKRMLDIIVTNLLSNALAYTAYGGTIRIESAPSEGEVLKVWDSGPPIPDEAVERIFDRFYRVEASRTGSEIHSGIGLALTRALCDALGLTVRAENGPDGAVAFRVLFRTSPSRRAPRDG